MAIQILKNIPKTIKIFYHGSETKNNLLPLAQ
jgi:hypothetical protein